MTSVNQVPIKCPFCDFENYWEVMILNHLEVKHKLRKFE